MNAVWAIVAVMWMVAGREAAAKGETLIAALCAVGIALVVIRLAVGTAKEESETEEE